MSVEETKDNNSQDNNSPEEPIDYKAKFEALSAEHKQVMDQVLSFRKFLMMVAAELHRNGMKQLNLEDTIINILSPKEQPTN